MPCRRPGGQRAAASAGLPVLESAIDDAGCAAVAIYFLLYLPSQLQRGSVLVTRAGPRPASGAGDGSVIPSR